MTKTPLAKPKTVKIKASDNKAAAVETREPDNQAALEYIDKLMQKAPGTRQEHITGHQALLQLGRAISGLKELPALRQRIESLGKDIDEHRKTIEQTQKKIKKLQNQINKPKSK